MAILNLKEYKDIKGISSTERDIAITQVIKAVNSYIPSYCNRDFTTYYDTDKTEYFDGVNYYDIYPDVYPIVSVTSLESSTDGGQTYPTALAQYTDYIIDDNSSRILSTSDKFVDANLTINSLKLVYRGGYSDAPEDLKMAAANLVEYFLDEQYTPQKQFSGVRVDNLTVTDSSAKLPPHIRRVLEHYRALNL